MKDRGLLWTILANKDDWRVYPEELARRMDDSVSAVRSTLKRLEEFGYVKTHVQSLGFRGGFEYHRFCSDKIITDEMFQNFISNLANEQNANEQNE